MSDTLAARRRAIKKEFAKMARRYANDPAGHAEALVQIAVDETTWMLKQGMPHHQCRMAIRDDAGKVICFTTDENAMERYRSYVAQWNRGGLSHD